MTNTLPQAVLDQQARAEELSDQINEILEGDSICSMDILDCLARIGYRLEPDHETNSSHAYLAMAAAGNNPALAKVAESSHELNR